MENHRTFRAESFIQLRRQVGFSTRKAVADYFEVSENTIYRWESGKVEIPSYAVKLLATYLVVKDRQEPELQNSSSFLRWCFRLARQNLGITQAELARRGKVSRSWIAHLERHGTLPGPGRLNRVLLSLYDDAHGDLSEVSGFGRSLQTLDEKSYKALIALIVIALDRPSIRQPYLPPSSSEATTSSSRT